jgi:hypothetical protein
MSKCGLPWIKRKEGRQYITLGIINGKKRLWREKKNACYIFLPEYVEIVRYLLMLDYKAMNVLTLH